MGKSKSSKRIIKSIAMIVVMALLFTAIRLVILYKVAPGDSYITAIAEYNSDSNPFHISNTYNSIQENLEFDENIFSDDKLAYYNLLDEKQKDIYRQMSYAINNFDTLVIKSDENTETILDDVKYVEMCYYFDHPETYWATDIKAYFSIGDFYCAEYHYYFSDKETNYTEEEKTAFETDKAEFDSELEKIVAKMQKKTEGQDDWNKALTVYKWMCDNITYDNDISKKVKKLDENVSVSDNNKIMLNGGIYSAVINKKTVCRGYAQLYMLIMQKLGIPCTMVSGMVDDNILGKLISENKNTANNTNHIWNIIKIDDDYYNVDVTSGDTENKNFNYDLTFFCADDKSISKTHSRSEDYSMPECTKSDKSFYKHEKLYHKDLDSDDLDKAVKYALEHGYKYASVQYEDGITAERAYRKFVKNSRTMQNILFKYNKKYDSKINIDDIRAYYTQTDVNSGVFYVCLDYKK